MQDGYILRDEVERKLRLSRLHGQKDQASKTLDKILPILARYQEENLALMDFLKEVVETASRQFWLKEVTIGLRDPDGKYRYKVMCGLRAEAWAAHQHLAYTREEFSNPESYRGSQVTKHTKVFLAEDKPFVDEELDTFTRPILLKEARTGVDDCVEGDYFDTHIFGENGELMGWIEISGTKDGKFPDPTTLRWIELLALVVGMAIRLENRSGRDQPTRSRLKPLIPFARDR